MEARGHRRAPLGLRSGWTATLFAAGIALLAILSAGRLEAQDEAPASAAIDIDLLLADPLSADSAFRDLMDRRNTIGLQAADAEDLARGAEDMARSGAYTTAIELLWFAEKMAPESPAGARYRDTMQGWAQAARAADLPVEEGDQYFLAGRHKEAIEAYLRATEAHPFNERAHFRLADAWREIYQHQFEADMSLAPLEIRVRVFQDAYRHYQYALAIDPLFFDAYYGLSELRSLIPEDQQFLLRTQPATQRALDFRAEVLPILAELESGEDTVSTFTRLGRAFEEIGVWDYAVFSYQTASHLGGPAEELNGRIEAIRNEHLGATAP
jgi:tetratricopeptide (TPR) repeat protein